MRRLTKQDVHKRGCEYCLHHFRSRANRKYIGYLESQRNTEVAKANRGLPAKDLSRALCCRFDTCPYMELENYKSYREYLKHKEGNGIDFKGII